MRVAAILFIVLTIVANFIFNNITSLVVAMFAFPVLLWVLLKRKKRTGHPPPAVPVAKEKEDRFQ